MVNVSDPTSGMRIDVQQLRGIAVLAVIVNHLDSRFLPGGYLGVDMFFVVSGFVIVNSLLRQQDHALTRAEFFRQFWIRRAFRLWPMLFTTVVLTSGFLVVFGLAYAGTLLTGLSSLAAISNFRLISGRLEYFALDVEGDWFMHTWSLAAEEQIYLVLSAIAALTLAGREQRSTKVFATAVSVISVLSLVFALSSATTEIVRFYSSHTRLYQVGFGALLAFGGSRSALFRSRPFSGGVTHLASVGSLVGLAILFATDVAAGRFSSLIASACTAMIIGVSDGRARDSGLINSRVLTGIGDRSYSLYLVHWPIQLGCRTFIESAWTRNVVGFAATFLIAEIAYRLVEERSRHRWRTLAPLRASLLSIGALAGAATAVGATLVTTTSGASIYLDDREGRRCDRNESDVWLVGDSHMDAMIPIIAEITDGDCRRFADYGPILTFTDVSTSASGQRSLAAIAGSGEPLISAIEGAINRPRALIIIHFLSAFLSAADSAPASSDFVVTEWRNTSGTPISRDAFVTEIETVIARLSSVMEAHGGVVIATSPPPDFNWLRVPIEDVNKCRQTFVVDSECSIFRKEATVSRAEHEARRQSVDKLFASLVKRAGNLLHLRLDIPFCDESQCRNFHEGKPAFIDDDHVSPIGRDLVTPLFVDAMKQALPTSPERLVCNSGTSVYACRVRLTGGISSGYSAVPNFQNPTPDSTVVDELVHIDDSGNPYCVRLFSDERVGFSSGTCGN